MYSGCFQLQFPVTCNLIAFPLWEVDQCYFDQFWEILLVVDTYLPLLSWMRGNESMMITSSLAQEKAILPNAVPWSTAPPTAFSSSLHWRKTRKPNKLAWNTALSATFAPASHCCRLFQHCPYKYFPMNQNSQSKPQLLVVKKEEKAVKLKHSGSEVHSCFYHEI